MNYMVLMILYNILYYFHMENMDGKGRAIKIESNEFNDKQEEEKEIKSDDEQEIGDEQAERICSILNSEKLFQQYLVDQYAKWESNNLRWYRNNQQNLRQEIYSGLQDFTSDMQQLYQDSMAIVSEFGKPDLFITVTCNPNYR
uniref:Helitron helicase-like domain-containing protein n=1 Tax=Rhizophagus irregularis (strain DAOM 181602 / DAOM 197198 / MUCL 43194) TaxID=747089 RepID=U9URU0_RHIID